MNAQGSGVWCWLRLKPFISHRKGAKVPKDSFLFFFTSFESLR